MPPITITAQTSGGTKIFDEGKVMLLWSFTVWLVVMNTTMFNVALPSVIGDLGISSGAGSWLVSGYSIGFAVSTLIYSRLSDFLPISRLLVIGLVILGAGSMLGLFSEHYWLLLGARVIQASGAGAVPGLAMVLSGRYIPLQRRGRNMAMIAAAASIAFGLGPVIGGVITQYLGWNYLFAVPCVTLLFIPVFIKLLPAEQLQPGRFDWLGALLMILVVVGVLMSISTFSSFILLVIIVLSIVLWRHLHNRESPFIQPMLLGNKQYLKLIYMGFTVFFLHFSTLFMLPMLLTSIHGKGAAAIGLIIFPGAMLSAFFSNRIGKYIDLHGAQPIILAGQILLGGSALLFALTAAISSWLVMATYAFMSIGFTAMTSSLSNEVSRILPESELGAGMGVAQLLQFIGGGFGVVVIGALMAALSTVEVETVYKILFVFLALLTATTIITYRFYAKNRMETDGSSASV